MFVEFSKRHEMKKLELCLTLPTVKMYESTRVPQNRQIKQRTTKALSKQSNESTWNGFLNLNEQSEIIRSLVEQFPANSLISWWNVTCKLPDNIKFSRHYLVHILSNGRNLQKWKQKESTAYCAIRKKHNFIYSLTVKQR